MDGSSGTDVNKLVDGEQGSGGGTGASRCLRGGSDVDAAVCGSADVLGTGGGGLFLR